MIHIKDMIILNVMRELSSFRNEASNLKGGVPTGINYFNAILLINSIIFYMLPKHKIFQKAFNAVYNNIFQVMKIKGVKYKAIEISLILQ